MCIRDSGKLGTSREDLLAGHFHVIYCLFGITASSPETASVVTTSKEHCLSSTSFLKMAAPSFASSSSTAVSATARGATFMILVQISSRALTFLANQLLLRYLSPALLGAATQLELYSISVLYFARESLRVALQRQTSNAQAVVNVSYIPIQLGVPLAYVMGSLYLHSTVVKIAGGEETLAYLREAVTLYGFAALVELVSEPCFVVMQMKMQYKVRAAAETAATIARCLVTFGIVVGASRKGMDVGVLPFACGQMAYASVLLVVYLFNSIAVARQEGFSLIPASIRSYVLRALFFFRSALYIAPCLSYVGPKTTHPQSCLDCFQNLYFISARISTSKLPPNIS